MLQFQKQNRGVTVEPTNNQHRHIYINKYRYHSYDPEDFGVDAP